MKLAQMLNTTGLSGQFSASDLDATCVNCVLPAYIFAAVSATMASATAFPSAVRK